MSETVVQKKIARLIQRELSEIISLGPLALGQMVTLSGVRITPDLSLAKTYVSVFPDDKLGEVVAHLNANQWEIRKSLSQRIRNKLRKMPELTFFADDTLQEVERMEKLFREIKGEESESAKPDAE